MHRIVNIGFGLHASSAPTAPATAIYVKCAGRPCKLADASAPRPATLTTLPRLRPLDPRKL